MSKTCLIVAHDPWFIQLLRIYSEECGFNVAQAYDGQDVLPIVHRERPVLILLEEDLPGRLKSKELLHEIRLDAVANHIPVLVFSWQGQVMNPEMLKEATSHLQAPITFESFMDALTNARIQIPTEKLPVDLQDLPELSGSNHHSEEFPPDRKNNG